MLDTFHLFASICKVPLFQLSTRVVLPGLPPTFPFYSYMYMLPVSHYVNSHDE